MGLTKSHKSIRGFAAASKAIRIKSHTKSKWAQLWTLGRNADFFHYLDWLLIPGPGGLFALCVLYVTNSFIDCFHRKNVRQFHNKCVAKLRKLRLEFANPLKRFLLLILAIQSYCTVFFNPNAWHASWQMTKMPHTFYCNNQFFFCVLKSRWKQAWNVYRWERGRRKKVVDCLKKGNCWR